MEITTPSGSKTQIITLGHKGKFIGVVGVFKTGNPANPYRFRYQRVEMTEDFITPEAKEKDHPILDLMEAYTKELKDKGYLESHGRVQHPLQVMPEVKGLRNPGTPEYAGSDKCKKCHANMPTRYGKNRSTPTPIRHWSTRSGQATGIRSRMHHLPHGWIGIRSGYVNEKQTPKLKNVGCESCHGPSSLH